MISHNYFPAHLSAMLQPTFYPHETNNLQVVETHISWVILTGKFAYKIKKNISLDFLDFSKLEQRKYFCQEELRLNQQFASGIYLEVVAVHQDDHQLSLNGKGTIVEYAVKMRQFPANNQLNQLITNDELMPEHINQLATNIAQIHQALPQTTATSSHGRFHAILNSALDNFSTLERLISDPSDLSQLSTLRQWTRQFALAHEKLFVERKEQNFIRECHGDLHLGNITLIEDSPVIFDCIEFNEEFRWIDVISDIAFLIMDLYHFQRPDLARHLLNLYLEITGDYRGLRLLSFYLVYRAMVRCKVEAVRQKQQTNSNSASYQSYLKLAQSFIDGAAPKLIITHGLSGSGKSLVSQLLVDHSTSLRIRSDVERKRLHGLTALELSNSAQVHASDTINLYSTQATNLTYDRLGHLAKDVIASNYNAIVDATFLKKTSRQHFQKLSEELSVEFIILDTQAPIPLLKKWITERQAIGSDPSDATVNILEQQISNQDPLNSAELKYTITIDTSSPIDIVTLVKKLAASSIQ